MSPTDIWNTSKRLRGWSSSWSRFINIQALSLSSTFINMRLSRPRVLFFLQQIKGSKNGRNSPCGQRGLFPKSQEVRGRRTLLLFHVSNYVIIKTQDSFGSWHHQTPLSSGFFFFHSTEKYWVFPFGCETKSWIKCLKSQDLSLSGRQLWASRPPTLHIGWAQIQNRARCWQQLTRM